ncbi:MAG: response regulator [Candidatus Omnitrophica bacterium]|nr:response regulator [Candidatus Omnitrophota bacterium]
MKDAILFVDDEETATSRIGIILRQYLEPEGLVVKFSGSGEEALEVIDKDKKKQIKLILLDLIFKGQKKMMQGNTICKEIRLLDCRIPIIMLTTVSGRPKGTKKHEELDDEQFKKGSKTMHEDFQAYYIAKRNFTKNPVATINLICDLAKGEKKRNYTIIYRVTGAKLSFNIIDRKSARTMTEDMDRHKLKWDSEEGKNVKTRNLSHYLEQCFKNPDRAHSYKQVLEENNWIHREFIREKNKLNDEVGKATGWIVPELLIRGPDTPKGSFKLSIRRAKLE